MIMDIQPQVAQLELKFRGPLVKDWVVQQQNDLLSLEYGYEGKLVWVKDESCFYYIRQGDGTSISDWYPFGNKTRIEEHNQALYYERFSIVWSTQDNAIFIALLDVPDGTGLYDTIIIDGVSQPYWKNISDSKPIIYTEFDNQSEVFINTTMLEHPMFQVFVNDEVVYPQIKLSDPVNNIWKITFYRNSQLINQTGYIVIK